MKLSLSQTIRLHREMWFFLYLNPEKSKQDWLEINPKYMEIKNECFCCEYSSLCENCIAIWPDLGYCEVGTTAGLWTQFCLSQWAGNYDKAKEVARKIMLLEFKNEKDKI